MKAKPRALIQLKYLFKHGPTSKNTKSNEKKAVLVLNLEISKSGP